MSGVIKGSFIFWRSGLPTPELISGDNYMVLHNVLSAYCGFTNVIMSYHSSHSMKQPMEIRCPAILRKWWCPWEQRHDTAEFHRDMPCKHDQLLQNALPETFFTLKMYLFLDRYKGLVKWPKGVGSAWKWVSSPFEISESEIFNDISEVFHMTRKRINEQQCSFLKSNGEVWRDICISGVLHTVQLPYRRVRIKCCQT